MPIQAPAEQHAVGGQTAVAGWTTLSDSVGFQEDAETTQNADGSHRCKITYSRRKTHDLELQAQDGAADSFSPGGTLTIATDDYDIESATVRKTRGPMMANVSIIAQDDLIT